MNSTAKSQPLGWPLIVLVGLIVVVAIGFGLRMWLGVPEQPDVNAGQAVIDAFLAKIQEGKPGEAWDQSSTEFKSIAGRESFVRLANKTPLLKEPLKFASLQKVSVQEKPRTEFLYQSTKSGGTARILLGYEGNLWKVDRLTL